MSTEYIIGLAIVGIGVGWVAGYLMGSMYSTKLWKAFIKEESDKWKKLCEEALRVGRGGI